ncbi:MAG: class B sortase, partial [Clostridia bacterium]
MPLLVVAILLLLAGAVALTLPVLQTELAIQQDAEEYTAWRETFAKPDVPILTASDGSADWINDVQAPIAAIAEGSASSQGRTGVDLSACLAANADFIGWLQIPGTTVDYSVVQTDEIDYYLNHTFTGKKSYIGTLFSLGQTDSQLPSRNIAIYGHLCMGIKRYGRAACICRIRRKSD